MESNADPLESDPKKIFAGLSTTPLTLPQFLIKQVLKGPGPQYQTSQPGRPWREKGIRYPVNLL